MPDLLQIGAKAALFAGMVLLAGAGVFGRWIAPDAGGRRMRSLRLGLWAGAVLAAGGSVLGAVDTVSRALGTVDPSMLLSYATDTRDGNAVIARLALIALVLFLGPGGRGPVPVDRPLFVVLAVALLLTISLVSHAGAQPGYFPLSADLGHLIGVTGWGGALVYAAWLLPWRAGGTSVPPAARAAARLSALGFWSIMLIVATGVVASLVHLWGPRALLDTAYGRVLLIKLALVSGVAAVAAVNRWVALPTMPRGAAPRGLGRLVKVESVLYLAVLGTTAVLISQAPPGAPPTLSRPVRFQSALGPWSVRGTLDRLDPGRFAISMTVRSAAGTPVSPPPRVGLTATMLDMAMTPVRAVLTAAGPGAYQGRFFLPMTGRWQLAIEAGGHTARVIVPTEDAVFIRPLSPWTAVVPGFGVMALGMVLAAAGLRRLGAGARPAWPVLGGGVVLLAAGVLAAVRAVS